MMVLSKPESARLKARCDDKGTGINFDNDPWPAYDVGAGRGDIPAGAHSPIVENKARESSPAKARLLAAHRFFLRAKFAVRGDPFEAKHATTRHGRLRIQKSFKWLIIC